MIRLREIEHIIGDLKCQPESHAKHCEPLLTRRGCFRCTCSETATDSKQLRRFSVNDAEVISLGYRLFESHCDLIELSFAGPVCGSSDQTTGLRIASAGCKVEGARKQVVSEEHACFGVPATMYGGHVTTQVGIVDDIIVGGGDRSAAVDAVMASLRAAGALA